MRLTGDWMRQHHAMAAAVAISIAICVSGCQSEQPTLGSSAAEIALTAENFGAAMSQAQQSASTVRLTSKVPYSQGLALVQTVDVSVGATPADLTARIVITAGPGNLVNTETRVVGASLYSIDHHLDRMLHDERPWLRTDLSATDDSDVEEANDLILFADPHKMSEFYADVLALVDLGKATVDGVAARCYRVSLPPAAMLVRMGTDLDAEEQEDFEDHAPESFAMKVCLDNNRLPVTVQAASGGIVVHFSDWGAPVEIKAPPSSAVALD